MPEHGRIFIDDLEGAPSAAPGGLSGAGFALPGNSEREDWMRRRNLSAGQVAFEDDDPYSARYARLGVDETAGTILHYWFGYSLERPAALKDRMTLWFGGGFDLDRIIAHRFSEIVAKLASGEAHRWAAQGPQERLAAVIALDQFSRNIFRGTPAAFENDALALRLCKDAIVAGEDMQLKPLERWFLYMPLEHSESSSDQRRSVEKFTELLDVGGPELREDLLTALDFAKRHAAVIKKFGRFPHRNAILGRTSTSAEKAFMAKMPGGF
ncbi:MAG: DUF924 family protein [Hyphomonadaceae bacterium]|nr:DUF924 family protein [Hyphomonadaceae bacterium]